IESGNIDKIATGHTLDDQAETVLFKLMRGAGTRGLAGIYPRVVGRHSTGRRDTIVVRPLLATLKADIVRHLEGIGQLWREDSTNRDLSHTRNQIRLEILPRLEGVNPSVRHKLSEAGEIARAEEEFWSEEISRLLPRVWRQEARGPVLSCRKFEEFAVATRRRLVRAAARSLGISLEFHQVEAVLAVCRQGGRTVLPGGWLAARQKSMLRFEHGSKAPAAYEYALPVPGKVAVSEAEISIEAMPLVLHQGLRYEREDLLAPEFAGRGLRVRNWRAGERFWPSHRRGARIKELLGERQIAGEEKKCWPVICCGSEVIWLRGFGVRRDFQARGVEGVLIRALPLPMCAPENAESARKP
ncbi:MAG: tRNA lysidine(34) synthetase TilS, partial [Acidobacteria bacterium]|nr:tRNA lysidine(34) synthetase TilS [Acidobacteriota bacterium]